MNLNILIIEDETIVAFHIKKTLTSLDHAVIGIAKNAEDAFAMAKKTKVDLVISDINIQGEMDGIECAAMLQEKYKTPVIFVTAYRDIATLQKASKIEYMGYLVKPFREDELETMINLAIIKHGFLEKEDRYKIGDNYSYSAKKNELYYKNTVLVLTKKEHNFIALIIKANGSTVNYEHIDDVVWSGEVVEDATRRQLVYRFRQKAPNFPFLLIKSIGYKLNI